MAGDGSTGTIRSQPDATPFDRLPDEIIEQILTVADANGFASLVLLNRKWRSIAQHAHIYLHHLAQCPSFAANKTDLPTADDDNLPALRRLFTRQVKRNLFDAYTRPHETIVKLVSTSISSSSCPGGEGMHFSASPRCQLLLAYNSARIFVLDVRGEAPVVNREFKVSRRPVAASIKDDGSLLAVLSTELQVDLYDLGVSPPRRKQAIILDNTPRTIALSPCGSVLAAAYEGGIEVSSIDAGALPSQKRSVKCDPVDSLAFSYDGTQIIGTTTQSQPPNTVIITAPYYDPGSLLTDDSVSSMWTTSILFPTSSRDCSHAVLLQDGSGEEASWSFAYDGNFEAFRAVRIDDLRNGTTYFTGPAPKPHSQAKLLPSTLPGATYKGDLVAAGLHSQEVWVYGVPENLDAVPELREGTHGLGRNNSERSSVSRRLSSRGCDANDVRPPQWQILCDKLRNTLVSGAKVVELPGVSNVKWVSGLYDGAVKERLLVTAKGVMPRLISDEEDIDFVDGGRIAFLDFDYRLSNGGRTELSIEVGTDNAEPLEEERRDMETEVAIVRRRTVAQQRRGRTAVLRAATTARDRPGPGGPHTLGPSSEEADDDDPLKPRKIGANPVTNAVDEFADDPDVATIEEQEAMESPYAHASPRSAPTLRRAATAAAVNQRLNPRLADGRPIEYRRADGRREHPHESDADNWVPPPPPYQKDDPGEMPSFMRGPAVKPMETPLVPAVPAATRFDALTRARGQHEHRDALAGSTTRFDQFGNLSSPSARPTLQHHRSVSDSTTVSRPPADDTTARPRSSPSTHVDAEDIYEVSPPASPTVDPPQMALTSSESRQASWSTIGPADSIHVEPAQTQPVIVAEPQEITPPSPHEPDEIAGSPTLTLSTPGLPKNNTMPLPQLAAEPRARRLSNAQTWPAGPGPEARQVQHASAVPVPVNPWSAPGLQPSTSDMPILPPAPSSGQMASLNKRISQGNPRRLSGGWYGPQSGGQSVSNRQSSQSMHRPQPELQPLHTATAATSSWTAPEPPMIISTPRGVSGAFDPPDRQASTRRTETPIVAPVPRHPRPGPGSSTRPTVERLETIYSIAPSTTSQTQQQAPRRRLLAPFRRSPSVSPGVPVGVTRNGSRAERSAALNIREAKKRGWDPSKSRKKKKRKDFEAASSAGWTDVSTTTAFRESLKDKRCVVM
ncbi:uncharacterized protein F5Z01DRAFT_647586 [Emericellopsis atlantica]|uniref:F-box domain-containing protein n=1 Tax=Emericellopsis atlantica TaxID=2614577 RepID=A0A9P8CS72_9HYPO|nr:uncharacterized protein F5Z01DRAFT_647586 [Emericellopsis atlantica]KAG9257082.1 hypothetical protein F5Z01DRAFT_647586 [Emericellopsis atlantica]